MGRIRFTPSPNSGGNGIKFPSGGNVSAALQTLQDPGNNNLPIAVSTSQVSFGGATAAARIAVRGDGVNPVSRFESSAGINIASVRQSDFSIIFGVGTGDSFSQIGLQTLNNPVVMNTTGNGHMLSYRSNFNRDWPGPMHSFFGSDQLYAVATQNNNPAGIAFYNGSFGITNAAASMFDFRMLGVTYTINNTAVSNKIATGIFLNATETNLNGMIHNLTDLQVGGVSQFKVSNGGAITSGNLSGGTLTTARPFKVGDRASITEAGLTALGLTRQIAIEHNGVIYYVPVSQALIP